MTIHLPDELRDFVQTQVQSGRYASENEAIAAAVRLLRRQETADESRALHGIRQGLDDMQAGRGRPADQVFDEIRREFGLSPDA